MSLFSWLTRRGRMESEMDAELKFHIESRAADLARQGASPGEALRRARLEFGGIEGKKEECRESLGLRLWDELLADCRYALRTLKQSPGFTAIAVVSLGLGIGANTAIFTLAKEILLKTMGVPHAERLRMLSWATAHVNIGPLWGNFFPDRAGEMNCTSFPYPLYLQMRRGNTVLDDLVAFKEANQLTASVNGQAEPISGMLVSGNFYQALDVPMIAGRAIAPEDDSAAAPPVAVISDAYWSRKFARSAAALGQTIFLNRIPVTIVGVNAPRFKGAKAGGTFEVFFPLSLQQQIMPNPKGSLLANNGFWWLMIIGRLKPGITEQAATAALKIDFRNAFHATLPDKQDKDLPRLYLGPGSRGLDLQTPNFTKPLYFLLALAGLVLLIACANLANLLLARSAARQREMSLRLAMGASRSRVMRQVLTESMLLAALGGAAGLLLAYWGRNFIPGIINDSWHPATFDIQMDWRVFTFALVVTIATGLLFGVAPAWRSTQADLNSGLKETGRMTAGRSHAFLGKALVVFQVSLSLLLLVGAGLFLRTLINLRSEDVGFNPQRILLFDLNPPRSRYPAEQRVPLFEQIARKIAALPGIQSSTLSGEALVANSMDNTCFRPAGAPASEKHNAWYNSVGPDFFETMSIPLAYGRGFTARDNQHAPKVAIVNKRLAKEIFPNSNPIGRQLIACESAAKPMEIVGVATDAKYDNLRDDPPPTVYFPYLQDDDAEQMTFELKTAAATASIAAEIREAVRSVDKDLPVLDVRTQTQQMEATLAQERIFATLTTGFGVLALILASIGIFGIMSYTVSRRTNEIGIRMALGARSAEVLSMVLRETLLLASIGVAVGLASAAALTRFAIAMLYNLKPTDPLTFGFAAFILVATALAAGFVPAHRAASLDPVHALRHE